MQRILIDARLIDGQAGGIQQVVIGIAEGMSQLDLSGFHIKFLCYEGHTEWLEPYLGSTLSVVQVPKTSSNQAATLRGKIHKKVSNWGRDHFGHLIGTRSIRLSPEPESVRQFNPDLIHFVHQNCFNTSRPYLFTPHDLQHEHYPQYFDKRTLMVRRYLYRTHAERASSVVCISESCREDVVRFLGVDEEKCALIYNAPLNGNRSPATGSVVTTKEKYGLPDKFLYYPAKTYPHKNHKRLLESLHFLKLKGIKIPLICSGSKTDYYYEYIYPLIEKLDLVDQVFFLGWLTETEVESVYELATGLIFPSEFEGFGLPLIEAMRAGLSVCCSNVSCILEIAGDAALTFDPVNTKSMATTMEELWVDTSLRMRLISQGYERALQYSWYVSAQRYLDLYRKLMQG